MKQESEIQVQRKEKSNVTKDVNDTPKRQTSMMHPKLQQILYPGL